MKRTIVRSSVLWPRRTYNFCRVFAVQGDFVSTCWVKLCFNRKVRGRVLVLGLFSFAIMAAPAHAQVSASITGNVVDAAGDPVREATITVKNQETGALRTVS